MRDNPIERGFISVQLPFFHIWDMLKSHHCTRVINQLAQALTIASPGEGSYDARKPVFSEQKIHKE